MLDSTSGKSYSLKKIKEPQCSLTCQCLFLINNFEWKDSILYDDFTLNDYFLYIHVHINQPN